MKPTKLLGILMAFLCSIAIVGCDDDENQGRKITDYKEYTLTIASKMLPGVVTSCGNSTLTNVYAVKNESQSEWQPLATSQSLTTNRGTNIKSALVKQVIWIIGWANLPGLNTSCWRYYQKSVRIQKTYPKILSRIGLRMNKIVSNLSYE